MKKFLLFMLGTLMALPSIARDFTYEYEGQTLTYTVLDEDAKTCETKGGSIFSGGNYVSGNLIIPATAKDGDMEYSVTSIGMFAFSECSELTSVTIPESVTSIGDYAFYWCSDLTSVEISNSVSSIGNNAFYQCSNLTSVTIGNSVSLIGAAAFYNCSSLTSVTIPGSVSSIGKSAFEKCSGLKSFKVADGESEISFDEFALDSCPIEDLYLGRNWTYSGSGALSTGIKTLTLGDKVTALPANAFSGCSGLTSVTIGNSVTSISNSAFEKCTGLKSFKVADGESEISFDENALASCPIEDLYLGRNWTYAGKGALSTGIKTLTLGDKVTYVAANAFSDCSGLTSVVFGNSLKSIGSYAFLSCTSLTSVEIPNSVKTVAGRAFYHCFGLTSVKVADGESVINFGAYAFDLCPIEDLYLGRNWTHDFKTALSSGIKTLTLGDKVTALPNYAFYGCSVLASVEIPNSVTSIGTEAFSKCTGLKSFKVADGESVISFGKNVLASCPVEDLYLGRNWTYAGSGAISTGIQTLTLGDKVTALPDYAFLDCAGLTSVEIPNSVTSIGDCAFTVCVGLTSVTIPNSVTLIGEKAFYGCKNLKSITISNSVTSISKEAFSGCSGLTEVIVPPSVETIGTSAFAENTKLSSIIMGHKVNTIGDKAFDNCPAQTVYITAQTPATVSDNTFSNYTGTLKVQGEAAKESYLSADYWKQFENSDLLNEPGRLEIEGGTNINGKPGDTIQLTATLYPGDVTLPQVFWRSTNPAVATVDHNGLVTIHADLSEIMAMAEGNEEETATQSCKIIAESLYANGPTAEFTIKEDITTGVEEISADVIDSSLPVQVYTLQGMMVGDCVENLSAGIYIVRQGKNVKKIAVK